MPLDYSVWAEIDDGLYVNSNFENEDKESFTARLRRVALRLPKAYLKRTVLKMKANIEATVASQGKNTIAAGGLDYSLPR